MKKLMYFLLFIVFGAFSTCSVFGDRTNAQTFQPSLNVAAISNPTTPSYRSYEFRPQRYNFLISMNFDPFKKVPPAKGFDPLRLFGPKLPEPDNKTTCMIPTYDFRVRFKLTNTTF